MIERFSADDTNARRSRTLIRLTIFILLIIAGVMSMKYIQQMVLKINPDVENCKGGLCKYSCSNDTELEKLEAKCSDVSKKCCVAKGSSLSPECSGKTNGETCGNNMLCTQNLECVSKCIYCANNPEESICQIGKQTGRNIDKFDSRFKCACSEIDCVNYENNKLGTCIQNFCKNDGTGIDSICCDTP